MKQWLFLLLSSVFMAGCFHPSRLVSVDPDHVVQNVAEEYVLSWPENSRIRKRIRGAEQHPLPANPVGKVVFETVYNSGSGFWHNKKVFVVKIGNYYYLIPEEGVKHLQQKNGH